MKKNLGKLGVLFLILAAASFGQESNLIKEKNESSDYIALARTKGRAKNVKRANSSSKAELNSEQYAKVLKDFMNRAEKYLEKGDKIKLVDDYVENIEKAKVSKKALEDNYDADREAFSLVEVAIFMKSSYSEGAKAQKLTEADYKRIQEKFASTNKFKQLEQHYEIQSVN